MPVAATRMTIAATLVVAVALMACAAIAVVAPVEARPIAVAVIALTDANAERDRGRTITWAVALSIWR